jgi:uncharacterized cupin superfamily protein
MTVGNSPLAVAAKAVAPRTKPSNYPEPFATRMSKREKRQLGDVFGLTKFGVNLTRIAPGGETALLHVHSKQEEFVYVVEGRPTLVTDQGEVQLEPGMCTGFAPNGLAHQLVNRTGADVFILEVGDRVTGDEGSYPNDDIAASMGADGKWVFVHKDGTPY